MHEKQMNCSILSYDKEALIVKENIFKKEVYRKHLFLNYHYFGGCIDAAPKIAIWSHSIIL